MKHLILLFCFLGAIAFKVSAQTTPSTDTTVFGSIKDNYPGGQDAYNKYINRKARYPAVAKENNIMGCTYIRFVIEKDSTLTNIRDYRSIGSGIDEEAVRMIKYSGKWIPNKINGVNVRTRCAAPVNFTIMETDTHQLGGIVDGNARDSDYLSSFIKSETGKVPLSEASDYIDKTIKFRGEIYGTKALSDTIFVLTCGEIFYYTKYINIALIGKDAQPDDPKVKLTGAIIEGTGKVIDYSGTALIIINDRKQYSIIKEKKR